MSENIKRKLTSRKFWAAVVSFVTMLVIRILDLVKNGRAHGWCDGDRVYHWRGHGGRGRRGSEKAGGVSKRWQRTSGLLSR